MKTQQLNQERYGENIFRLRLPSIKLKPGVQTIALDDVFYISVGMVLNAHEKHYKGAFELDDLISQIHDAQHPAPYVGGRDIIDFGISAIHYLWNTGLLCEHPP